MSTSSLDLPSLCDYHKMILMHTYSQMQIVLESQTKEVLDMCGETTTIFAGENGIIANLPIDENVSELDSA
jgi:hypothetical protein